MTTAQVQTGHTPSLDAYVEGLKQFVKNSPSSFHAAHEITKQLQAAGFQLLEESEAWSETVAGEGYVVVRDGAVIAWRAGDRVGPTSPVNVLGSHTDSPSFKITPTPAFEIEGWAQAGVEIYGGPLLNSWLDRDLEFAGRLVLENGKEVLARTGAVARIPQLAIHLDREANKGLTLNRQKHTQPILGVDLVGGLSDPLYLLAQNAGVDPQEIVGFDVLMADTQEGALLGADKSLFASGRLDNLSSAYASLVALLIADPAPGSIAMLASFDHEEVGSGSRSGAAGPFLEEVLGRIYENLGASLEDKSRAMNESWCISADAGHSVHPNYVEKHDPVVRPIAGRGPALKVNAVQRYASDAHGDALWRGLAKEANVATQAFVCNNEIPCGSTIGPLTATRLGIRTVDVGVPLLSMHSARELAHTTDLYGLALITKQFYESPMTK
ncbi:MAG TPA: M18 family aminopeptidase [Microbacteriaceae bacterium]|nr:M18 family aminopeptidase [Microbacteriaceae bacterium]